MNSKSIFEAMNSKQNDIFGRAKILFEIFKDFLKVVRHLFEYVLLLELCHIDLIDWNIWSL